MRICVSPKWRNAVFDDHSTLDMKENRYAPRTACPLAKCGTRVVAPRGSGELRGQGKLVNTLRPRTMTAAAIVETGFDCVEMIRRSCEPDGSLDAARPVAQKPLYACSGHFFLDDRFFAGEGVVDFMLCRVDPSVPLQPKFFVPDDIPPPRDVEAGSP